MTTKNKAAQALRAIPSAARYEASRINGAKGGRPSPFRRVTDQNYVDRVYEVPDSGHWAGGMDADAVTSHGTLVAWRYRDGQWCDAEGYPLDRSDQSRFSRLKSIGISTH